MRPVNISAASGKEYYYEKDPIFNDQGKNNGTWQGKGAEVLGISGEIHKADFEKVIEGKDPKTGEQLVEVKGNPEDRRAATDIPFSPPKSVSICALVLRGEHEKLIDTHKQAVTDTINYLEKNYAYCRETENGITRDVQTSNFVVAKYEHGVSRMNDPQIHTHAVFMNMTQKENGEWRATHNDQIFKDQVFVTQVYNSFLAKGVKDMGYAIDVKPNGTFEIRGVPQGMIDLFSKRSEDIEKKIEELKEKYPDASREQLQNIATLESRPEKDKDISKNDLNKSWDKQTIGKEYNKDQADNSIKDESFKLQEVQKDIVKMNEYDCVRTAGKALVESESVFTKTELLSAAAKFAEGEHTADKLDKAFSELQKDGEFINRHNNKTYSQESVYSTPEMYKKEKENVQIAKDGQGTMSAIMGKDEVDKVINDKYSHLTNDQKTAVSHILSTTDKVTIIIGDAGTGKTTMAGAVREMTEARGIEVRGYSKTNEAVLELEKGSGIKSQTLDSFLLQSKIIDPNPPFKRDETPIPGYHKPHTLTEKFDLKVQNFINKTATHIINPDLIVKDVKVVSDGKANSFIDKIGIQIENDIRESFSSELHIIDEGNTMSAKEFNQFIKTLGPNDRVVVIGDTKQFSSISAGKPMHDMIEGGIKYVNMKETTRFVNKDVKEIVEAAARKDIDTTFEKLEKTNKIHQIENREDRLNAIAKEFLKDPNNTIGVTNINADRHELNNIIHKGLQEQGKVSKEEYTFTIREPKNINPIEKQFAQSYKEGDSIFINKPGFQGAKLGTEGKIITADQDRNILRCETKWGKTFEINLRKDSDKISTYEEKDIKLAEGDKIIWNKKDKELGVVNGTRDEIIKIDKHGNIAMGDKEDKITHFNVHDKNNFSHSYCITSYKSEGKTGGRSLYHADAGKAGDFNSIYVGITRGREDVQVYTNNKEELKEQMKIEHEKESTLKYDKDPEKEQDKTVEKDHEKEQDKTVEKDHDKNEDKGQEKTEDKGQSHETDHEEYEKAEKKTEGQEHEAGDEGKAEDRGSEKETEHQEYEKSEHETEHQEQEQKIEREHEDNSREIELEI